jgi:hypothetical protein
MLIMTGVAFVSAGFGGSDLSNRPATNAQPVTRDVVANEPAPTPLVE